MKKPDTYKVIREYGNRYGLEELMRRIVRCHLGESDYAERAGAQFPESRTDDYGVQLTG